MTTHADPSRGESANAETKLCGKCKATKPASEFSKDRRARDGLSSTCKACAAERNREYRAANRERIAEYRREYRAANRERIAEYRREYRAANRERIAEYDREYREANRDRVTEWYREWYAANRDRVIEYRREYSRAYYEANKAQIAKRNAAYREANRERLAERDRAYREANRAQIAKRNAAYREANRERIAEYNRVNAERIAERRREYNRVNAERIAERRREYHRVYYEANRYRLLKTGRRAVDPLSRKGFVYRMYDETGDLLYVGLTYNITRRFFDDTNNHSETKDWFDMVAFVWVEEFATYADAQEEERHAYVEEMPIFNRAPLYPTGDRPTPVGESEYDLETRDFVPREDVDDLDDTA